jgi:hypothetical protein
LAEALAVIGLVILALVLRSSLDYRTASGAEATHLFGGWQVLHSQETYAMAFHAGWPPLSMAVLGWVDGHVGLTGARALSAAWGVLTVLLVTLTARRLYGSLAGLIAGGLMAVYGPAIHTSTFATQDSLAIFLTATAIHLTVVAITGGRRFLYLFVGLALALATLVHYVALIAALALGEFLAVMVIVSVMERRRSRPDGPPAWSQATGLLALVAMLLPWLALMIAYVTSYRIELAAYWQGLVLAAQSGQGHNLEIFRLLRELVGLVFLIGILAFDWRGKRVPAAGLFVVGLAWVGYLVWSGDTAGLVRLTVYMLVAWAPLAAGGLATLGQGWGERHKPQLTGTVVSLIALGLIGYIGWSGQAVLAGNRQYWPDATQLVDYLRSHVSDGDQILMEQGVVGRYYLIAHATPGHVPAQIWDTWWYQDEEGQGSDVALYERAIRQGRFDFVVFDYTMTADLNRQLVPALQTGCRLAATFPADTGFSPGIEVYRRLQGSE